MEHEETFEQEHQLTEEGLETVREIVRDWNNGWSLEEIALRLNYAVEEVLLLLAIATLTGVQLD